MIQIRTMGQIRTSRMIPSFRACQTLSGLDLSASDRARRIGATAKMLASESRRQWIKQWQGRAISVPPLHGSQRKPTDQ
jgi:hypothetical protein